MGLSGDKDQKAEMILAAVRTVLAENGYMGTTINLVAKKAEVSRGLLHYYFKNKEEMLARVIKENMQASVLMITSVFEKNSSPQGFAKGIVDLLKEVMAHDPHFFNVFFEGFAVARQSDIVRNELVSLYGKFRLALEGCLEKAQKENIINPKLPVQSLAAIITSLIDGLGLQLLTEPELCENRLMWVSVEKTIVQLINDKR